MKSFYTLSITLVLVVSIGANPLASSTEEGNRLIQVSETEPAAWLNQEEINSLIRNNVHFMDITNRSYPKLTNDSVRAVFPENIQVQDKVLETFKSINTSWMTEFVRSFSSFKNRFYKTKSGAESSEWLYSVVSKAISQSGYKGIATVEYFTHSWLQKSIIARISGYEDGVVILGAHQDSVNKNDAEYGVAPGADDNASGTVAILEACLILLESGFLPKKTIEFHWYAAEEIGLRGSQDIAENYFNKRISVISMLNFDVVGYSRGSNQLALITDNTHSGLNEFLRKLIEQYLTFGWTDKTCGYACSDHASWTKYGFPAAMPAETNFTPYMHTIEDTVDRIDFNQIKQCVQLALAYSMELAE